MLGTVRGVGSRGESHRLVVSHVTTLGDRHVLLGPGAIRQSQSVSGAGGGQG